MDGNKTNQDNAPQKLDDLSRQIIQILRVNGRQSNREIARIIGVSEGTIRNRLRQLTERGVIQIAAITDMSRIGYRSEVIIGMECDLDKIESAAEALARLDEVRFVSIMTGSYDILISVLLESTDQLLPLLTQRIGKIPGIRKTWSAQSLRILKRNYEWLPGEAGRGGRA